MPGGMGSERKARVRLTTDFATEGSPLVSWTGSEMQSVLGIVSSPKCHCVGLTPGR